LAFCGLSLLFYTFLGGTYFSFRDIYSSYPPAESEEQAEWQEAVRQWGSTITQEELSVKQTVKRTKQVEVGGSGQDTHGYIQTTYEDVDQDGILGFYGLLEIQRLDRSRSDPLYNAFTLWAHYEYDVANPLDEPTRAEFRFPLSENDLFEDVRLTVDDQEIASRRVEGSALIWEMDLTPRQHVKVVIEYRTRGIGKYSYSAATQDVIENFVLTFTVNTSEIATGVTPQTDVLQSEVNELGDGEGESITFRLTNQSIINPRIAIYFLPASLPYRASTKVIALASLAPRALMLFLTLTVLTFLICDLQVELRKLALLATVFCLQFVGLMGMSVWVSNIPLPMVILRTYARQID
jgi:hypothetical protein